MTACYCFCSQSMAVGWGQHPVAYLSTIPTLNLVLFAPLVTQRSSPSSNNFSMSGSITALTFIYSEVLGDCFFVFFDVEMN